MNSYESQRSLLKDRAPGPASISDKTSYRKILRNLKAMRLVNYRIALKFDWHISSTTAKVPVKFPSDRITFIANLAASRLYEILQKDVLLDIEMKPRMVVPVLAIMVTYPIVLILMMCITELSHHFFSK